MSGHPPRFGARCYRAALRLTPRAHRDRFAEDQVQLYDDLARAGHPPWQLWLDLPRDVVRVRAWTPRRGLALKTAGGPAVPVAGTRHAAGTVLSALAVIAHTCWLTGHLAAGLCWTLATTRAAEVLGRWPMADDASGPGWADQQLGTWVQRTDALVWPLALTFPLVMVGWIWLPRRGWFTLAWAVAWPLGMLMLRGWGDYTFE
jgi:hypothetical protein